MSAQQLALSNESPDRHPGGDLRATGTQVIGRGRVRVLVLADTHLRPGLNRTLPSEVWTAAAACDVVIHAGDVLTPGLLAELAELAPVHAVLGNNDVALRGVLPETLDLDLEGLAVSVIHDAGARAGREARMRRRFPHSPLVVFGHSHLPLDEVGTQGQRLFNPGSCTERRRAPSRTYGWFEIKDGHLCEHRIVEIDSPADATARREP